MRKHDPLERLLALPAYSTAGDVALKPGFDRIEALLQGMGHPERDREIILVAGTNGKGSTASLLASLSTASGICTGLHTSPHLLHVSERMRVDGRAPDEDWLCREFIRWEALMDEVQPSFFEATLALSLCWFAARGAERWIVEIGLGGRLDAANVLEADLGVLTSVGRDHMHLLGPTLADVAAEKAAIARRGRPFVLAPLVEEARTSAMTVLDRIGARVVEVDPKCASLDEEGGTLTLTTSKRTVSGISFALAGKHQRLNALLALESLDQLHASPVDPEFVCRGLREVHAFSGLRARQEWVFPDVMVDVGHNEEALQATFSTFLSSCSGHACLVVLGFLADKELGELGTWFQEKITHTESLDVALLFVDTDGARGLSAADAARRWRQSGWAGPVSTASDPALVLRQWRHSGKRMLFAGSYRVAARVLAAL